MLDITLRVAAARSVTAGMFGLIFGQLIRVANSAGKRSVIN
jgi:hypothetical protein